jgi:hypothetical protein
MPLTGVKQICDDVLSVDGSIRFAGVADPSGKVVASVYRSGLVPLLTEQESELSILQSAISMPMRKPLEEKLGGLLYSTAIYRSVACATISLLDGSALMVSFEAQAGHERLIPGGIMPLLQKRGLLAPCATATATTTAAPAAMLAR